MGAPDPAANGAPRRAKECPPSDTAFPLEAGGDPVDGLPGNHTSPGLRLPSPASSTVLIGRMITALALSPSLAPMRVSPLGCMGEWGNDGHNGSQTHQQNAGLRPILAWNVAEKPNSLVQWERGPQFATKMGISPM